jgi:uncharacterized protein YoxC
MDLSTTQQILVIILSTALAVALVLAIAISIMLIRVITSVRRIVEKAERAIESAEAVGDVIKKTAGNIGVLRIARAVFDMIAKHRDNSK